MWPTIKFILGALLVIFIILLMIALIEGRGGYDPFDDYGIR